MGITRVVFELLLLVSIATNAWSHHHHHHHRNRHGSHLEHRRGNDHLSDSDERKSSFESEKTAESARSESLESKKSSEILNNKDSIPFSPRRLEKMLEKAILKIIMGDLGTAEMLLLKSLNYTPEEVLAIRERELDKRKDEELRRTAELKSNRKFYGGDLYGSKAKHWNYNSMEFDSSARNEPDIVDVSKNERKRNRYKEKASYDKDFDFDAYNRQAVIDYENLASKLELQQSWPESANTDYEDESRNSEERDAQNFHRSFDRAMEPHVIFKIPYDDSEFDSSSDSEERSKLTGRDSLVPSKGLKHHIPSTLKHTSAKNVANSFHAPSLSTAATTTTTTTSSSSSSSSSVVSSASAEHTSLPVVYQLGNFKGGRPDYPRNQAPTFSTTESPEPIATSTIIANVAFNATPGTITDSDNSTNSDNLPVKDAGVATNRNISEYEGLEWVEDDVYRVIPSFVDSLAYDNSDDNETSDYGEQNLNSLPEAGENDTLEYQNDAPDPVKLFMANINASIDNTSLTNLSTYQQLALAHRREENVTTSFDSQGQKAIEDIKTRVLALTGRFNLSTNTNQVQRERLTMFSPTCQIPRNTDSEAWMDPFSMNMHFQLNLTSGDHVIAAKLRMYKLPQENLTVSASGSFDEDEDDEKKIRISIYYYTKSLKKHRSKKRLMDSIVTPLTMEGTHLALDVRQGLRFWRLASRNPHGNGSNHGLVIQIEDQDGRSLKPALYIQQPSCGDHNSDQKPSAYLHCSYEPVLVTFAS